MAKGQVRCGQCNHVFNAADEIVVGGNSTDNDTLETKTIEVPEIEAKDIEINSPQAEQPETSQAADVEEPVSAKATFTRIEDSEEHEADKEQA